LPETVRSVIFRANNGCRKAYPRGDSVTTLKDISRHLGLSVTQVSRALNGHSDVNEDTRQRVREAAKYLNYHPNLSARKLATGRSGIVGLVVPAFPTGEGDTLFVQMVAGLSARFAEQDVRFILHIANESEDPVDIHRKLVDSASLDGFVIVEPQDEDPRIAFLQERGIPFVVHGRIRGASDFPYFDIDNRGVAHQLTRHLTEHGHRRIAFLNGAAGRSYCTEREIGYRQALTEAGAAYDPALHRNGVMDVSFGLIETVRIMQKDDPPTAFVAGNTAIAKGIYQALNALRLSVPDDVSVVAHDDLLPQVQTSAMHPALTVTESPVRISWGPLADLLVGALNGSAIGELQQFGAVSFISRASVRGL
jgi:LacI family transcriptional regulator